MVKAPIKTKIHILHRIPLGTVVHDNGGHPWVYVGWRFTAHKSYSHRFYKAQLGKSNKMPIEFHAVKRSTLLKMFPDIGTCWPDPDAPPEQAPVDWQALMELE